MGQWKRRVDYQAYLRSDAWRARRRAALARAGCRCEWVAERSGNRCTATSGLEVHHLTYLRFGHEHPDDLQVLCAKHHAIADRRRVIERDRAAQKRARARNGGRERGR